MLPLKYDWKSILYARLTVNRMFIDAMQLVLVDMSAKEAQSHQVAKLLALQLLGWANLS